jgi:hypothetical protein
MALVLGELFAFARHTVTQGILALGLTDSDWSAWYRLFSRRRFEEEALAGVLLRETLADIRDTQVYVLGLDATQMPRSSRKMPGRVGCGCPTPLPAACLSPAGGGQ